VGLGGRISFGQPPNVICIEKVKLHA